MFKDSVSQVCGTFSMYLWLYCQRPSLGSIFPSAKVISQESGVCLSPEYHNSCFLTSVSIPGRVLCEKWLSGSSQGQWWQFNAAVVGVLHPRVTFVPNLGISWQGRYLGLSPLWGPGVMVQTLSCDTPCFRWRVWLVREYREEHYLQTASNDVLIVYKTLNFFIWCKIKTKSYWCMNGKRNQRLD